MRILFGIVVFLLSWHACLAQSNSKSAIEFTTEFKQFGALSKFKASLKDVEIIALGENTHGLGEVFKAKTELVQFLHEELGFDLILFESGYGDAALAWEKFDQLSATDFTRSFSSNFYYQSEELRALANYCKQQQGKLSIQAFDCQVQQDFLRQRMSEIIAPIDTTFAKAVKTEMRSFNKLYQFEHDKDTIGFRNQRDQFISFLEKYKALVQQEKNSLLKSGTSLEELQIVLRAIEIFKTTYAKIQLGDLMGWPRAYDLRDQSMFENIKWFKDNNPNKKIIIWAQNSHIENHAKPDYTVNWMGHLLKKEYGSKYYSIGAIVYSGKDLGYNGLREFEHNNEEFLAYHLNTYGKERFVVDLRQSPRNTPVGKLYLGMESNGNTAAFIAKDRFDGLLFIRHSEAPKLLKE